MTIFERLPAVNPTSLCPDSRFVERGASVKVLEAARTSLIDAAILPEERLSNELRNHLCRWLEVAKA